MIYTIENQEIGKKIVLTVLENGTVKEEYFEYYKSCDKWRMIGGYCILNKEFVKEAYGIIID